MATGGKRQESLERRESEIIRVEESQHKKGDEGNPNRWELENRIKELEGMREMLRNIRTLHEYGTHPNPLIASMRLADGMRSRGELDELEGGLKNPIWHSPLETHTKGSAVDRGQHAPDTAAVEQCDPEVTSANSFTQTSANQQTQKTSRPGIENFSQTAREVREAGNHNEGGHTHESIGGNTQHTLPSLDGNIKNIVRGIKEHQMTKNGGHFEQDRGPREQTMLEIVIERNLQLTFTQNGPYLNAHNIGDGGERQRDRTRRMEEQEDLTLERTIQENEWNIKYAMRIMHEAIWVEQQLIQIQQDRLDQSPSHDINIRTELRTTQRMIREAEELTSTAKDLLTVYSWHKEAWQRGWRKEQLTSNGAGQEDKGRKGEKQQTRLPRSRRKYERESRHLRECKW